jgi:nitrate reductase gamma subunit
MSFAHTVPILLGIMVGLLIMLVAWGLLRSQRPEMNLALIGTRDDMLVWLLILAAFILGASVAYFLLSMSF